jgi:HMG box factor
MVRLFNRFYALSAVAACTILSTAWFLTSHRFPDIIPLASGQFEAAAAFDQRLVVFGDSWSDNETFEPEGKIWTDWLCSMVRYKKKPNLPHVSGSNETPPP